MKNKITIIIPTHERPAEFKRCLAYYEQYKDIINVKTIESEDVLFIKCGKILKTIDTEFVVFCADDDFVFVPAIKECLEFLEKNKDYSVCHGNYYKFFKENPIVWKPIYQKGFTPTFYAVHRTKQLRHNFDTIRPKESSRRNEMLLSLKSKEQGKIKKLDIDYSIREGMKYPEKWIINFMSEFYMIKWVYRILFTKIRTIDSSVGEIRKALRLV